MIKFSEELVEKTIKLFREEYNAEFTHEQAEEALCNLSGLYLAFAKPNKKDEACSQVNLD